jgi:hypothetical protein
VFCNDDAPFAEVHVFLAECGVIDSASSSGRAPQAPQDAKELAGAMEEVDGDAAISVLVAMTSYTLAYGVPGRYTVDKAQLVFERLADLLGYGTRWWTNTDLSSGIRSSVSWNPVTRHGIDAIVVGIGGGVMVVVLAADED